MMRAAVPLLLLFALGAGAQYYPGDYFSVAWNGWMVKTDQLGMVTSIQINTSSRYQVEMALDNTMVLVPDQAAGAIWIVDPNILAVVGTLATHPYLSNYVYGMQMDSNGDLLVASQARLLRIDPAGRTVSITQNASFAMHLGLDIDTGDLISGAGTNLYRLARDGSSVATFGTGFNFRYGDIAQDVLTGDVFVPTCCGYVTNGVSLHVLRAGTSVATVFLADPTGLVGAYGPNPDRASAARPRLVTGSHIFLSSAPNSGGMWYLDLATATPTKLAPFPHTTLSDSTILGSREIQSVRTAPGRYDLRFNIPTEGGIPYVAAVSLSGVRPSIRLPDGRRIALVPDTFTVASVSGWLVPFLTGNLGSLDPFGRATARLDVSSIYSAVKGLRLWVLLITLDSRAPLGLATICDPRVLVID
jgi:hypothetical protein